MLRQAPPPKSPQTKKTKLNKQRTNSFNRRMTRYLSPPIDVLAARKSFLSKNAPVYLNLSKMELSSDSDSSQSRQSSSSNQSSDFKLNLKPRSHHSTEMKQTVKSKERQSRKFNVEELEQVAECDSLLNDSEISIIQN